MAEIAMPGLYHVVRHMRSPNLWSSIQTLVITIQPNIWAISLTCLLQVSTFMHGTNIDEPTSM